MFLFKNRYGELRSGWGVTLSMLTMLVVQLLVSYLLQWPAAWIGTSSGIIITLLAILLTLLPHMATIAALLLLFRLLYKRPLAEMGLAAKSWLPQLAGGSLFGIGSMGLVFALLLISGQAQIVSVDFSLLASPLFWTYLLFFLLVGFTEEILTRGFMMTAFKTTRSKIVIFTAPALLFSLLHIMNDNVTFFSLVNIFIVGLLFAYMFVRSGKIWWPIGYHFTWNFFQGNVFGIAVSGNETASLVQTRLTGPDWITGGAIVTLVILLGFLFVRFCIKKPANPAWSFTSGLPLTRGAIPPASAPAGE